MEKNDGNGEHCTLENRAIDYNHGFFIKEPIIFARHKHQGADDGGVGPVEYSELCATGRFSSGEQYCNQINEWAQFKIKKRQAKSDKNESDPDTSDAWKFVPISAAIMVSNHQNRRISPPNNEIPSGTMPDATSDKDDGNITYVVFVPTDAEIQIIAEP